MARITIEDCIEKVPNRFHLVQMAAIRAKQIKQGARTLVETEDNKAVVVALREIAAGRVKPDYAGEDALAADAAASDAPVAAAPESSKASETGDVAPE